LLYAVAPRAGAWIETKTDEGEKAVAVVAPRAGAWIETALGFLPICCLPRRPPRGGVD